MKFKAIIFDMDGTIIDTSHIWAKANKVLIESNGITYTQEIEDKLNKSIHGLALDKVCKIIKDVTNMEDHIDDIVAKKTRIACDLYRCGITFIEGFEQFHSKLEGFKLKSGIATNADDGTLQLTKDILRIERFFGSHIYNISHVNNVCKPDPAVYLYAAKQLELNPADCMAIEDSAHGIKAAKSAGMYCIGINTSRNYAQVKDADLIVDRYDQIDLNSLLQLKQV